MTAPAPRISPRTPSISPSYVLARQVVSGLGGHGGDRFYTLRARRGISQKCGGLGNMPPHLPQRLRKPTQVPVVASDSCGGDSFSSSPPASAPKPKTERKPEYERTRSSGASTTPSPPTVRPIVSAGLLAALDHPRGEGLQVRGGVPCGQLCGRRSSHPAESLQI